MCVEVFFLSLSLGMGRGVLNDAVLSSSTGTICSTAQIIP